MKVLFCYLNIDAYEKFVLDFKGLEIYKSYLKID